MTDTQPSPLSSSPSPISQTEPIGNSAVPASSAITESLPLPVTPSPEKNKYPLPKSILFSVGAFLFLGIIIFGFLYFRTRTKPANEPAVLIPPTIVPSPTPLPNLSRISSTSAFMKFSDEIASFSSILNAFTLQDGTLSPPTFDATLEIDN